MRKIYPPSAERGLWKDIEKYISAPSPSPAPSPPRQGPFQPQAAYETAAALASTSHLLPPPQPVPIDVPRAIDDSFVDQAEIQGLKNRYIVGKIAGEDLLDDHGSLIVAKGRTIDPTVLRRAEGAGKLVELILNMVIPET